MAGRSITVATRAARLGHEKKKAGAPVGSTGAGTDARAGKLQDADAAAATLDHAEL